MSSSYKFIDLFAGLGGFHNALQKLGHQCVFACEIENELRDLYHKNYGIRPAGDIKAVKNEDIPNHDILCAGFPCQPFSLAGKRQGVDCNVSGRLIDEIFRIVSYHKPKFVLLENVPSVLKANDGEFWKYIQNQFDLIGYKVDYKIYSPHQFNIPQQRKRIFIIAYEKNANIGEWPLIQKQKNTFLDMAVIYLIAKHGMKFMI